MSDSPIRAFSNEDTHPRHYHNQLYKQRRVGGAKTEMIVTSMQATSHPETVLKGYSLSLSFFGFSPLSVRR